AGTRIQIAYFWFRSRSAPRNPGEPRSGVHRVSGNPPRPAGFGWCCPRYGAAGAGRYLDSSPTRAVDRSCDTATRGMTLSIEKADRRMGLASDRTVYSSQGNRPLLLLGRPLDDRNASAPHWQQVIRFLNPGRGLEKGTFSILL